MTVNSKKMTKQRKSKATHTRYRVCFISIILTHASESKSRIVSRYKKNEEANERGFERGMNAFLFVLRVYARTVFICVYEMCVKFLCEDACILYDSFSVRVGRE